MNANLLAEAKKLVQRAGDSGQSGTVADPAAVDSLNQELGGKVPPWYAQLITTIPLCGLELGWQSSEPDKEYDGVSWLRWLDTENTRIEAMEAYPGLAILARGYLCVGGCSHGSGDQYFISTDEGDDPPLYQIDHESGDEAEEILAHGRYPVSPSLSGFFRVAKTK